MTASWREHIRCENCGEPVSTEYPFDRWVRTNPHLDSVQDGIVITDGDKWVHRYALRRKGELDRRVQYLMSVEVKSHEKDLSPSQRDTLLMINALLRTTPWREQRDNGRFVSGHPQNVRIVHSWLNGSKVMLLCYGIHKLRLSHSTPDDSDWMTWDDKKIDRGILISLLRFDTHPDSLRPMEHRRHKFIPDHPVLPFVAES